ncbi:MULTISPECIES: cytochrome b [Mycolicibacterium]|uniref:Cytochrome B561 n=1 Tax=Mycolicibacterium senegalense TaxID=1796 RepID=A0A378T5N7_9MYCO|nr:MULTISPECIES: cytochrome b/b6 domain-containing protein [Mycolicibacterium]MCV7335083.1 cytochrome b [Mycolicibacterium senegalense]MDR7289825.1 cytochrome b561 [Mycolicibacterium senegalense]QZA26621.1 cytochrome b/b6 domain-containing protein [Mycolicibacterium senegalense]CDP82690.1 cytochrome b561 family protein [Mycolicibacterium farcinogenes]STZ54816.1 cytochrome B561 [Mycolicibacterium senegalense]
MTTETKPPITKFNLTARLLHWSMAVMVIAQFFLGVTMIAALSYYPLLLAIHRPLGIAILVFVIVRLINRLTRRLPPFLTTMGLVERRVATYSEYLLYALLLAQPVIGWAMLSAAQSPVVLVGAVHLPAIAPHNLTLYAVLRTAHTVAAYLLFATFTAHICAVLFHTVALRDGIVRRMSLWPGKNTQS